MLNRSESSQEVIRFLAGERVYLRPIEREDLDVFCRWANDPVGRNLTGDMVPHGRTELVTWFERSLGDPSRMRFILCLADDDEAIGTSAFLAINQQKRAATLDVAIGEKRHWGKGYATEAMLLMLDYGFGTLNLHRVGLEVFAFNERALNIWERLGFQREGVLRDAHYTDHRYHDVILMSLLEDEFRARYRSSLQDPERPV